MHRETVSHKGSHYTIIITRLDVGNVFGSKSWKLFTEDCRNELVVSLEICDDLAGYIQSTYNDEPEVFLCGYAKSIIAKR